MELQIFDADYVLVNNKPVVRLFCKDINGEPVCVFYDKYLPFFYLHSDPAQFDEITDALKKKYPEVKVEIVERMLPIGYQPKAKLLKIIGKDPGKTPEMREFVSRWGTPYEADILFRQRFMVDHGLRGMGWMEVSGKPTRTMTVKCKAIHAETIQPIDKLENAPLRYLSIDIECLNPHGIPDPERDMIIMISLVFDPEYKGKKNLVLVAKSNQLPGCRGFSTEEGMLEEFVDIIKDYDPDVLTGYNIENFDMPYIIQRLCSYNLPRDLGRSEKMAYTKKMQHTMRTTISGRAIIDPYFIIKHLSIYDQPLRLKRYDLNTVAKAVLGSEKLKMNGATDINRLWVGSMGDIQRLAEYSQRDAELAMQLVLSRKLIDMDKFFEICKLSGLLLQDIMAGQAARHEAALLRELGLRGMVMPCRPDSAEMSRRTGTELKGALVLEPVVGHHTDGCVVVLDFTALYPSLICAYNICPSTLVKTDIDGSVETVTAPSGARFVKRNIREGVLPAVAHYYLNTRSAIRKQIKIEKDPERVRILDAKQYALKGMAVSLYGYTGFAPGRLFTPEVTSAITAWGRENIEKTRKLVEENFPVKVIYGDTDSMFLKTNEPELEAAAALGEKIAGFVTERTEGLELKLEKVFKSFIIEAKKRYAGWAFERTANGWRDKIETKGIETVRRDWAPIVSDTMNSVLEMILKENDVKKAMKYVRDVMHDIAKGTVPLEKLAVVKGVTKSIEEYDGVQPHIELAKKIMERDPSRGSMVGERLEFVIVRGNDMLSKRAEDPEYVKEKGLEIDTGYYIESQLLPPLERVFDAVGITKQQLVEGTRQTSLMQITNGNKPKSPEQTVLDNIEAVVCRKCNWSFRRPTLTGNCPSCGGTLYFSSQGSIGKFVK